MTWTPEPGLPVLGEDFPLPLDLPFTTAQACERGITRGQLGRLLRAGLLRRLLRGVYVAAQAPDRLLLRARALALVAPSASAATDWTACWLHCGLLPPGGDLEVPPVSFFRLPGHTRLRNNLCDSGERHLQDDDVIVLEGLRVTTPLRTALDLGRLERRDWAIAAMDALARTGSFLREELLGGVERFGGQRGVVQLRDLAPRVDPRAESPGESVVRLRWSDLPTLPQPRPQVPIPGPDGRELYRIDLGVEALRFGVEYDGREHHTSDEDRAHDRERRLELEHRFGWLITPVTKENVFGPSRDVERLLHEGIRAARRRLGRFPPDG